MKEKEIQIQIEQEPVSPLTRKIIVTYFNPESGFSYLQQIYDKLRWKYPNLKMITFKIITEALSKIKNYQLNANNITTKEIKLNYIPIVATPGTYQVDLWFHTQYKWLNRGFHIIMNIINVNTKFYIDICWKIRL